MGYSDFTLKTVQKEFDLTIIENRDIFSETEETGISEHLSATLNENVPLALAINTEKARSELIIVNVLVELRRSFNHEISFFSGTDFSVDRQRNLNGFCDYIISGSAEQFFLNSPVVAIVEAKNENIAGGFGACIAEMLASQIFNEKEGKPVSVTYGAVTTGNVWKFLKLENSSAYIDLKEYHINDVRKIMGILSAMIRQNAPTSSSSPTPPASSHPATS